jgi:hypothetical protein
MLRLGSLIPLLTLLSNCGPHQVTGSSPAARAGILNIPGYPVVACQNVPAISYVVRVKIHDNIDDILKANPQIQVKYQVTTQDDDHDDAIYATNGVSFFNRWSGPLATNEVAPLNVDLKSMGASADASKPQWTEVKILLKGKHGDNLHFYTNNQSIFGVTVDDQTLTSADICYADFNKDDGNGRITLKVFVRSPRATANPSPGLPYRFNIAIVSIAGAIDTPIVIDPKILNNG